jgi:hypothetical protein
MATRSFGARLKAILISVFLTVATSVPARTATIPQFLPQTGHFTDSSCSTPPFVAIWSARA